MVSEIKALSEDLLRELHNNAKEAREQRNEIIRLLKAFTQIDGYDEYKKILIMNAAKKTKTSEPLDEKINHLEHLIKVLIKGQQEIKSHLGHTQGEPKPSEDEHARQERQEAWKYINNVVMPEIEAAQAEKGEIGTAGLWDGLVIQVAQPVLEYLKTQTLNYIGKALAELKMKAIPLAVQAADGVIDKLENIIVNQYNQADEEQKATFKAEIADKFPNSRLLEKL